MFGVLFCTWVLTAVAGLGVAAVSTLYLVLPEGGADDNGGAPIRPRPKATTSAAALAVGVLMVVWPLPFCRRSPTSEEIDGFGRGW